MRPHVHRRDAPTEPDETCRFIPCTTVRQPCSRSSRSDEVSSDHHHCHIRSGARHRSNASRTDPSPSSAGIASSFEEGVQRSRIVAAAEAANKPATGAPAPEATVNEDVVCGARAEPRARTRPRCRRRRSPARPTHGTVSTPTEIAHAKIGVAPRGVARVVHRFAPAHGLEATHDDLNDRGSLARDF
jgi:hypothetical protein